jgi:hypothetical protein
MTDKSDFKTPLLTATLAGLGAVGLYATYKMFGGVEIIGGSQ